MDAIFARVIGRSPVVLGRAGIDRDSLDVVGDPAPAPPEAQFVGAVPAGIAAYPEVGASLTISMARPWATACSPGRRTPTNTGAASPRAGAGTLVACSPLNWRGSLAGPMG